MHVNFVEKLAKFQNVTLPSNLQEIFFKQTSWICTLTPARECNEFFKTIHEILKTLQLFVKDKDQRSHLLANSSLGLVFFMTAMYKKDDDMKQILHYSNSIEIDCKGSIEFYLSETNEQQLKQKIEIGEIKKQKTSDTRDKGKLQLLFRLELLRKAASIINKIDESQIYCTGRLFYIKSDGRMTKDPKEGQVQSPVPQDELVANGTIHLIEEFI